MGTRSRLLLVDDEPHILRVLQAAFDRAGYETHATQDARSALDAMAIQNFHCVVTDVTMPGMSGYDFLKQARQSHPDIPVVIMTAYGTIPAAVQAIRDGAFEYVTKPFDLDALKKIVAAAVEQGAGGARENETGSGRHARRSASATKGAVAFVAESTPMKELLETVRQVADSRASVLITGESGVGKEVVAKALHAYSSRACKPFVAVSCAAIPETLLESELFGYEKGAFTGAQGSKPGKFELAHGGTLFLDEIGDVPLTIQVKLLRVLQEREVERLGASKPVRVDIRLVAATNRDLAFAVEEGTFRLDLLYRLQVIELRIPPLRERKDDILPLAQHFLARFCAENGRGVLTLDKEAARRLADYPWPGNVRELENAMERAAVLAPKAASQVGVELLPPSLRPAA